jgi:hypothetical protein
MNPYAWLSALSRPFTLPLRTKSSWASCSENHGVVPSVHPHATHTEGPVRDRPIPRKVAPAKRAKENSLWLNIDHWSEKQETRGPPQQ